MLAVADNALGVLKAGAEMKFHCSFHRSRPRAVLSWIVDGQEVRNRDDCFISSIYERPL